MFPALVAVRLETQIIVFSMEQAPVSPIKVSKPELVLESASINSEPVELDGTPTSPDKAKDVSDLYSDSEAPHVTAPKKSLAMVDREVRQISIARVPEHRAFTTLTYAEYTLIQMLRRAWQSSFR